MESQADTYIEECFEQKCSVYKDFKEVLNQWRKDKDTFSEYTSITNFDFQHYSMHDKTHSIAILQNIEMILGRERVKALNVSNLWLLLETAYCHDIGMSVTYEELCIIWESDEFQEFIIDSLDSEIADNRKAGRFYEKLNALIHNQAELEAASKVYDIDEFDDDFDKKFSEKSWPVAGERYIMMLYTEYIRKLHPELSRDFMLAYSLDDEKKIPSRMYRTAAIAAFLHGTDFDKIFEEVPPEENGFKGECMHPQFAAAMLRLGDLLDMDNNRFNIRMMNHMGIVPLESTLHLKKHKAITHLSYSEGVIEAEARSDEFEVCKTAQQWFYWLDEEVRNLICSWNKMVPPELRGCRLNCCDLKIYYKNKIFDASRQTKFVADSARVYKMLIGNNIYKSRLDFIREYLQNALDASKMRLWLELKEDKKLWETYAWTTITPYDLPPERYKRYGLEVHAHADWEKQQVEISFQDHGIGMEEDCVSALAHIADDSWKRRKAYAKEIPHMPVWLRPTGGFGIGVQSAFMITDCVEFITKTEKESCGRRICMEDRRKGGRVSEYAYGNAKTGTKVVIKVRFSDFFEAAAEKPDVFLKDVSGNIYDRYEISKIILDILYQYIAGIAEFSLLPVTITCDKENRQKTTGMKWLYHYGMQDGENEKIKLSSERKLADQKETWIYRYAVTKNRVYLWVPQENAMVLFTCHSRPKQLNSCYYKGILISGESFETPGRCSVQIHYFDHNVSSYLTINRDNFHHGCSGKFQSDVIRYRDLYARILAADADDFDDCSVTGEIGVAALISCAFGKITMDKKIQQQLLSNIHEKAAVKRINFKAAENFLKESEQVFHIKKTDPEYAPVLEKLLFVQDEVPLQEIIEKIQRREYFFYEAEKESSPYRMRVSDFVRQMLISRTKQDHEGLQPDISGNTTALCQLLACEQEYIISEKEICRILQEYSVHYGSVYIKEGQRYIMRIAGAGRKPVQDAVKSIGVREFIKSRLSEELEREGKYPIVLGTSGIREDDLEYNLWITKTFPNTGVISLDGPKRSDMSRFLILPLTESSWMSILNIIRFNNGISRLRFDEIAKNRSELKFLTEWTFTYQDYSRGRLKREQIYEQYEKLLDLIYSECVSHMRGELFYHFMNS